MLPLNQADDRRKFFVRGPTVGDIIPILQEERVRNINKKELLGPDQLKKSHLSNSDANLNLEMVQRLAEVKLQ